MSKYENSIKCKYCGHFEPGANRCHLYHDFDQSLDKKGGPYFKDTSPDNRCLHFTLTAMDAVAQGVVSNRPDGSRIVTLDDDLDLKYQLQHAKSNSRSEGCYIATCVYGSYDCPQVCVLRRFRDNMLATKWYGRVFIRTYYAVSPKMVKKFGYTKWFKKMWRGYLDRLVQRLQDKGIESTFYLDIRK